MSARAQQLFDEGLQAYRTGHFELAASTFAQGLAEDKAHWEMHFYLGMTNVRLSKLIEAKNEFLTIRDFCPDAELRKKAATALGALSPTMSQQGIKKLSSNGM